MAYYTEAQRQQISDDAKGKTVKRLEYVGDEPQPYWVMEFTDGSEMCFRFMFELSSR
jgi:hypothetical protein